MKPLINLDYLGYFGSLPRRKERIKAIVIHHTCTTSPRKTRKVLQSKGYSTHFEVDQLGNVYQYANCDRLCSHCGSANVHTIGIDVTHPQDADFPEVQIQAVRDLVTWLCAEYRIPQEVHEELSGIYPHRALASTVCPQDFPLDRLNG